MAPAAAARTWVRARRPRDRARARRSAVRAPPTARRPACGRIVLSDRPTRSRPGSRRRRENAPARGRVVAVAAPRITSSTGRRRARCGPGRRTPSARASARGRAAWRCGPARLQPEQAAQAPTEPGWRRRRRSPARGREAGRDGGGRAAARPAAARSVSHGLRVAPCVRDSVKWPHSGQLGQRGLAEDGAPGGAQAAHDLGGAGAGFVYRAGAMGRQLAGMSTLSFTATGTPSSGRDSPAALRASSAASASLSAASARTTRRS